jgi:hypothetical protein
MDGKHSVGATSRSGSPGRDVEHYGDDTCLSTTTEWFPVLEAF